MSSINNNRPMENHALAISLEIQETLAQSILHDNGINPVNIFTSLLAEKTGCCAVLEDKTLSVMAVGLAGNDRSQDALLQPYFSLQTSRSFSKQTKSSKRKSQVIITDQYDDLTIHRLLTPVTSNNELLGFLTFLTTGTPFSEWVTKAASYAVHFIAVLLAFDRKIAEIELRLKGNFIEDLISGNHLNIDSIANRARALGYDITIPNRVLVAEFNEAKQFPHNDKNKIAMFKDELVKRIQSVSALPARSMVVHRNNEIIILCQDSQRDHSFDTIKHQAEEVIREVSPLLKTKLYIGIGSRCSELEDYRQSYLTAKKALEIGKCMITEDQVCSLEKFKMHALFLSTLKPAELYAFAERELRPLLNYDDKHQSELVKTLQEFLYLRNNVEGTAKSLNMSVSGIKYRLKKIEKIIGHDLKDNKVCFDLQLALVIHQLYGRAQQP